MPSEPNFFERMTGKRRTDINLPADKSQMDPRLKGKSGYDQVKKIRPSMEALRKLGK